MIKADIIKAMAQHGDISERVPEKALAAFVAVTTAELHNRGEVIIKGFGRFYTYKRRARLGRNPRTNEGITIPAAVQVKFRPGHELRF